MISLLPTGYEGGAASYSLLGAFFPAWLVCAVIGLVACFVLRGVMIAVRLDDAVPLKVLVYTAFAVLVALSLWLMLFGEK